MRVTLTNTDYMDFIRGEIRELETRCPDLLTELVMESLVEMNGPVTDVTVEEIYDFIEQELTRGE